MDNTTPSRTTDQGDALLGEQAEYYRARAPEYDDWWQRTGRYDRGFEATARWRAEVAQVDADLDRAQLTGDVLELACGTGWWTERLARKARTLTCIDASPETLEVNRTRLMNAGLPLPTYDIADLFNWTPAAQFDAVFFSFWLSHVPNDRFEAFWAQVAAALRPGGRAYLIDSLPDMTSTAHDHRMPDSEGLQERRLNDGRTFRIVKLFRQPDELNQRLQALGWSTDLRRTPHYFVFGEARLDATRRGHQAMHDLDPVSLASPASPIRQDLLPSARENLEQLNDFQDREDASVTRLQAGIEAISRFFGSSAYFVFAVVFIVAWVATNTWGEHAGWEHYDKPPFFWLQGLVSANALLLTVAVLIRQNRMARQSARRAHLDLHINLLTEEKVSKVLEVVHDLAKGLGKAVDDEGEIQELATAADPKAILTAIKDSERERTANPKDTAPGTVSDRP